MPRRVTRTPRHIDTKQRCHVDSQKRHVDIKPTWQKKQQHKTRKSQESLFLPKRRNRKNSTDDGIASAYVQEKPVQGRHTSTADLDEQTPHQFEKHRRSPSDRREVRRYVKAEAKALLLLLRRWWLSCC